MVKRCNVGARTWCRACVMVFDGCLSLSLSLSLPQFGAALFVMPYAFLVFVFRIGLIEDRVRVRVRVRIRVRVRVRVRGLESGLVLGLGLEGWSQG